MKEYDIQAHLKNNGISRRSFLKYCTAMASAMALEASAVESFSKKLLHAKRSPVLWLSFQECTGCTESLTRSHAPTIEELIFNFISLNYHHTLQAASGEAAEAARKQSIAEDFGEYYLIVDGSVPVSDAGV